MSKIVPVSNLAELNAASGGGRAIAYFWASWAPMCTQTEQIFQRLAEQCPNLAFLKVEAEAAEVQSQSIISGTIRAEKQVADFDCRI
jgi:hypothetical protein